MSHIPSSASFDNPRPAGNGLAVAAIICASIGLCVPLVGIVGLVLGIVAIVKASGPNSTASRGLSVAAIVVGSVSIISSIMVSAFLAGIFVPALGKARESARQLKSKSQLQQIAVGLSMYSQDNGGWLPEPGADWQARLTPYSITPAILTSPRSPDAAPEDSYVYIPGFNAQKALRPASTIVAYENPKYLNRGMLSVAYLDGHVEAIPLASLAGTLAASDQPGVTARPPSSNQAPPPRRRP